MPNAIRPARWEPPPIPERRGTLAPDRRLSGIEHLPLPDAYGPEDVAVASDGTVYTGVEDGRILALGPEGSNPRALSDTAGRPMGIEIDRDGSLVVCDAIRGLLRVHPDSGEVEVLTDSCDGRGFGHANNPAIDGRGRIYFSDAAPDWPLDNWIAAVYENRPTGILYRYDPGAGTTSVVAEGFAYANGVAVAPDDSFVLVAESPRYRVQRVWLTGESAGTQELFIDNLPGFPDNIAVTEDGRFWIALANGRDALVDRMWRHPRIRRSAFRLPESLRVKEKPFTMVVCVDGSGEIVDLLEDPEAGYPFITGVREHNGYLYLGSLQGVSLARLRL